MVRGASGGMPKRAAAPCVEGDENIHLKFLLMGFNGRTLLIRANKRWRKL
jgi:hypothetical protein